MKEARHKRPHTDPSHLHEIPIKGKATETESRMEVAWSEWG
jgi:hypothetical protein